MALPLFALVNTPKDRPPVVRGMFTTANKAKLHDEALKGLWVRNPKRLGGFVVHEESLLNRHEVVPYFANEELDLR